jgi:hypothetical protein
VNRKIVGAMLGLLLPVAAFAGVDIENKDSRDYKVRLECGGSSTEVTVSSSSSGNHSLPGFECTLKMRGATLEAKDGDSFVIEDGKISKK